MRRKTAATRTPARVRKTGRRQSKQQRTKLARAPRTGSGMSAAREESLIPGRIQPETRVARGPRTDDTRDCDSRGVRVQSGNGSAAASASTSPGGSSAVAGGGSPGARTEFFGCDADDKRSAR